MKHTLLEQIMGAGGISVLFQPIYAMNGGSASVFALEALARGPKGSNAETADVLFEYVRRKGKEVDVDRTCVAAVLRRRPQSHSDAGEVASGDLHQRHAATLEQDDARASSSTPARRTESRDALSGEREQKHTEVHERFSAHERAPRGRRAHRLDDIGSDRNKHALEVGRFIQDRPYFAGSKEKTTPRGIESIVLWPSIAERHRRVESEKTRKRPRHGHRSSAGLTSRHAEPDPHSPTKRPHRRNEMKRKDPARGRLETMLMMENFILRNDRRARDGYHGEEAVIKAEHQPDMILPDVIMPRWAASTPARLTGNETTVDPRDHGHDARGGANVETDGHAARLRHQADQPSSCWPRSAASSASPPSLLPRR